MEVWAALSPLCLKAQETKVHLSGQRGPEVTLTKSRLLTKICSWVRAGGVSAEGAEVWKLKVHLSLGGLSASPPVLGVAVLCQSWRLLSSLHFHRRGLLFSACSHEHRAVVSVGWAERRRFLGALAAAGPRGLSAALPFGNLTSPGWGMRGDVCHCHARSHSSACSSAVSDTAGCAAERCAGPHWHPARMGLNQDHNSQSFLGVLFLLVSSGKVSSAQLVWNLRRSRKSMFVFFSWSWRGRAGCFSASNWLFCWTQIWVSMASHLQWGLHKFRLNSDTPIRGISHLRLHCGTLSNLAFSLLSPD